MKQLLAELEKLQALKSANVRWYDVLNQQNAVECMAFVVRIHAMKHAYRVLGMRGAQ